MIKKVIALVFVSFFVMSGLTVLNENNQNYNIFDNYINNFVVQSPNYIVNLTYVSDFNLSNVIINKGLTPYGYDDLKSYYASYHSNLYYLGLYNSNYYIYDYSILSKSISQYIELNFTPFNLGIYSGILYISYTGNRLFTINLTNNEKNYYNNFVYEPLDSGYPFLFYNNTVFQFDYNSALSNYCFIGYNIFNSELIFTYILPNPSEIVNMSENGNFLYFSVAYDSSYTDKESFALNLNDLSNSVITSTLSTNFIYAYNNYSYIPSSYIGEDISTTNTLTTFTTNTSNYLPFSISATDYNNFSFSPYNFYDSSLGNKSIDFYPHFINGYKDNTFLYSTLNNQKYYMSLPFNFSSSKTYFLVQGKAYLYMINRYNDMVYVFKNPIGSLYYLTVKSYNSFSSQINNYLLFNGQLTTTSISIANSYPCVPTIIPLNYSTYYYNGSKIIITSSDYTGSFNKYYNLSIYYNQVQSPSIPLYDIFTYMYPISIIGLFVGMGAFVFAIKKRGYKIWIL